jgi:ribosomal protein L16 Arg81 hydroxylase
MATKKIDIDKIIESYLQLGSQDPAILDDMLREHGYKPEELEKRGTQFIRNLFFQHELECKKERMKSVYDRAASLVQSATATTKEAIFQLLRQKSPSLQFRNLETLDEENLRQILSETEILELIDKLEKGEQI